jgi:TldD protein
MKKYYILFLTVITFIFTNKILAQDIFLDAMQGELNRSKANLTMPGSDKPYYIAYHASDVRKAEFEASFGGLLTSRNNRARACAAEIKTGDYHFDNTNISGVSLYSFGRQYALPIEDNDYEIRYELWLITDKAYKTALDEFGQKKAALQNKNYNDKIDDFSKGNPVKKLDEKNGYDINSKEFEEKAVEYSKIFKNYPAIYQSSVSINCVKGNRYFLNTEVTIIRKAVNSYDIEVGATAIDRKGNNISNSTAFYAKDIKDIKDDKSVIEAINKMAKELEDLSRAPIADDYNGPVLFTNEASANYFSQMFAKTLSGRPAPFVITGSIAQASPLIRKTGRKVFPEFISIYDDPNTAEYKDIKLLGSYKTDEEGVDAEKVQIVENGILKNLLMCRKPGAKADKSNGHGRSEAGRKADARPGNIFITSSQNKSYDDLKKELLNMCKEQDLEYGIIIKKISDPAVFYKLINGAAGAMQASRNNDISITAPVLAYKVYVKDGKEELVRGFTFPSPTIKMFSDIVSASNDYYVFNHKERGNSGEIPVSIIAPSILMEDCELNAEKDQNKKPLLMKHPYFSRK